MKKITQEEVEKYFKQHGGWSVISQYNNYHENILIEKDGYMAAVTYANFKKKNSVILFGHKNPYFKKNIELFIKNIDDSVEFVDASLEKKSGKSRMVVTMVDNNGHKFKQTLDHIRQKKHLCCTECQRKIDNASAYEKRFVKWIDIIDKKGYDVIKLPDKLTSASKIEVEERDTKYRFSIGMNCFKLSNAPEPFSPAWNNKFFMYNLSIYANQNNLSSIPIKYIGKFDGAHNIVQFQCKCGELFERSINKWMDGRDLCSKCSPKQSLNERRMVDYLDEIGILFKQEYTVNTCRDKNPLPFDFYLIQYNAFIEIDGEQHYEAVSFGGDAEDAQLRFALCKKHDAIKTDYCIKYNIPLLRIPYWYFNNDSWKTAIQEFIKPLRCNES